MGEVNKFSVKKSIEKYVFVTHNIEEALKDDNLNKFFLAHNVSKGDIFEIKEDSDKNIDKYNEIIYIGYRIPRLIYRFTYDNENTYVDNTYFITRKKPTSFSLKYVIGVLNSELMRYYIDHVGKKKDFEIEIGANFINNLPLIIKRGSLTKEELKKIEEIELLISEIIKSEQNNKNIDELIENLNNYVYNLYQITGEEQKLIKFYLNKTHYVLYEKNWIFKF